MRSFTNLYCESYAPFLRYNFSDNRECVYTSPIVSLYRFWLGNQTRSQVMRTCTFSRLGVQRQAFVFQATWKQYFVQFNANTFIFQLVPLLYQTFTRLLVKAFGNSFIIMNALSTIFIWCHIFTFRADLGINSVSFVCDVWGKIIIQTMLAQLTVYSWISKLRTR